MGVLSHLQAGDMVFSNHRCHGHFLAYGGDPRALFAELMGKATRRVRRAGRLAAPALAQFLLQRRAGRHRPGRHRHGAGRKASKAAGQWWWLSWAMARWAKGWFTNRSTWPPCGKLPILYVVENNRIAQTTPIEQAAGRQPGRRFSAFGIPLVELDTSDVLQIQRGRPGSLLGESRQSSAPQALILHTCRFGPHSKGDDTRATGRSGPPAPAARPARASRQPPGRCRARQAIEDRECDQRDRQRLPTGAGRILFPSPQPDRNQHDHRARVPQRRLCTRLSPPTSA